MSQITLVVSSPDGLAVKRFDNKADANNFAGRASAVKGAEVLQLARPDQLKGFGERKLAELFNLTIGKDDKPLTRMQKTPSTFTRVFEALTRSASPTMSQKKEGSVSEKETAKEKAPVVKRGKKAAKSEGAVSSGRNKDWAKVRMALGKNTARETSLHGFLQKTVKSGVSNGETLLRKALEGFTPPRSANFDQSFVSGYLSSAVRRGYLTAETVE